MEYKDSIKAGVLISYITLGMNCLVSIFFTPFMIHVLGEGEYGLYQLIGAFVGYLSVFDMGLCNAVTKYAAKYRNTQKIEKQENFLALMAIWFTISGILIIAIGLAMYGKIDYFFGDSLQDNEIIKAKKMFLILLLNMVVTIYGGIFRGVISAYEKYVALKGTELLKVVVRIFLVYALLKNGGDSVGLVIIDTFINCAVFLVCVYISFAVIKIKIKIHKILFSEVKEIIFYSSFVFLNLIFDQLNWKIDHFIIGMKLSTTAVTIYSIGINFSNFFMNMSVAIKSFFLPKVMKMEVQGADNEKYTDFLVKTGRVQGFLLFYLYIAFVFMGRQFITIIMQKDYYEAWLSAVLVMGGLLVPLLQNAGHSILQVKNKHHIYVIVCAVISIINAISTWIIIGWRGITGAAFMTMLSFILGQAVFLSWYYHVKIGIRMDIFYKEVLKGNVVPSILVCILELIWIQVIVPDNWGAFILHGIGYTLIYWGAVYFIGMNKWEKQFLLNIHNA